MKRDLFGAMVRHSKGHSKGGNDVAFHSVWNGTRWLTVPSYSTTDPFAPIGVEATRVEGSKPRGPMTVAQIELLHKQGAQVAAIYGDEAVGDLPPLPKRNAA